MSEDFHPDEETMAIGQKAMDLAMKKLIKDITKKIVREVSPDVEDELYPDNLLAPYFEEAFLEVDAKARQIVATLKAAIHGTYPAASLPSSSANPAAAAGSEVSLSSNLPTDDAPSAASAGGDPVNAAGGCLACVVAQEEGADSEDPDRVGAEKVMAAIARLLPATKGEALSYTSIKDATGLPDSELEMAFMELCGEDLVRKRKPSRLYVENAFWLPQPDPRKITYAAGMLFERITRRTAKPATAEPVSRCAAPTDARIDTTDAVPPSPAPCPPGMTRYLATVAFLDKVGGQPWAASRIIDAASSDGAQYAAQEFALDVAFEGPWVEEADGLPFDQAKEVLGRNGFLVGDPDVTPLGSVEISASDLHNAPATQPSTCAVPVAEAARTALASPTRTDSFAHDTRAEVGAHLATSFAEKSAPDVSPAPQLTGISENSTGLVANPQPVAAWMGAVGGGAVPQTEPSRGSPPISGGANADPLLLASQRRAQLDAMTGPNLRLLVSRTMLPGRVPLMSFGDACIAGKEAVKARLLQHEIETGLVVDDVGFAAQGPLGESPAFGPGADVGGNDPTDPVVRS